MNRILVAVLVGTAVLSLTPVESYAQSSKQGYVLDRNGSIVKTRAGTCVRNRHWTAALADKACEATLSAQASSRK